jgi:peptidoglycan/xylan/chitin deacetylase (PgdA/CDA1 family)
MVQQWSKQAQAEEVYGVFRCARQLNRAEAGTGMDPASRRRMTAPTRTGPVVLLWLIAGAALWGSMACDVQRTARDGGPDADARAEPGGAVPETPAMAITIDDLPWIGGVAPGETRLDAMRRMIDALVARDVPALGFVNCERAGPGAALLAAWLDAGLEVGNHSAAHLDLNQAPLEQWLRDVRSCHHMIRDLMYTATHGSGAAAAGTPAPGNRDMPQPAPRIWFRYPYLHQGPTAERQQAALALLHELDSPIAHVTIDNSDWILAVAYVAAVSAGDSARAAAVGEAFVDHILRATRHYQRVAADRVGRDVPHVLLLHANLLVADHLGTLLDRLQAELGFRFVSVAAAQRDPVYDLTDGYTGPDGLSWLYRFEPTVPELSAWDDAEARRLRQQYR